MLPLPGFVAQFATGFDNPVTPGFCLENSLYKIQYESVHVRVDGVNIETHQFGCYNWREVIKLLLSATEKADNDITKDIEEAAEDALKEWMTSFQGWGLLLLVLVPVAESFLHILVSLHYHSKTWNVDTHGEYTKEKVFNIVKQIYNSEKEIERLVPDIAIRFNEIMSDKQEDERKKSLTIHFDGVVNVHGEHVNVLVTFVVEKKRVNNNLVELSAEILVKSIYSKDEVESLEIPKELLCIVMSKFRDAEWVRAYRRFHSELKETECERLEQSNEETAAHDQTVKFDMD